MRTIDLSLVDSDDRIFVQSLLTPFPVEAQRILFSEYLRHPSKFERNTYLRQTTHSIAHKLSIPLKNIDLNIDEDGLRVKAKEMASAVLSLRRFYLDDLEAKSGVHALLLQQGIEPYSKEHSLEGEMSRYCDPKWWLRRLRKALRRNIETVLHHLNQVNKKRGIYASDITLRARIQQKYAQKQYLENTIAINELGQSFSLLELSQKGVSDPTIRKGELMLRARGFEELAQEMGHEAAFLTLTCPSKYHRSFAKSGHPNPKWDGATPLDAQEYLNNIWQLIRATLSRLGIRFYGFRVAEPQHDGTPHWHLLLFVEPAHYQVMVDTMRKYNLLEDGQENGALEHRFTEVKIDPSRGSATGYIAKYISKNIDGSDLDSGVYGEDPKDAAARVDAWAACWGIRQFQQLGGCSVTVWRELRRLKEVQNLPKLAKDIIAAADIGNWKDFTQMMGGVFSTRKEQVFKPLYAFSFDRDTGAIKTSLYCARELVRTLKGITAYGQDIISRVHQWCIDLVDVKGLNLEFCE
ncbi:replication endonuclease [Vibrio maerlii]|uniref:replication endonuclease n=1 Tax=Vibrio maerlii TaxID=2231648 RepID=UPI000E3CEE9F|nr:replication endonuclease [Vibrio maerlii]